MASLTITLRQALALLDFFGNRDCEVTVAPHDEGLAPGLYAYCSEYPDEGAQYLGPTEVDEKLADEGMAVDPIRAPDLAILGRIHHAHANALQVLMHMNYDEPRVQRWAKEFEDFRDLYARHSRAKPVRVSFLGATNPDDVLPFYQFVYPEHHITKAAQSVLDERRRQVDVEGWTAEHDDAHGEGSMAVAAACYALTAREGLDRADSLRIITLWKWTGWAQHWFKPGDTRSNLVRAAALILAEIERLDRAADKAATHG